MQFPKNQGSGLCHMLSTLASYKILSVSSSNQESMLARTLDIDNKPMALKIRNQMHSSTGADLQHTFL